MSARNIKIFLTIISVVLLCAAYFAYKEFGIMHRYTIKDFAENPSLLNGATLRGSELSGLTLKKATIRGVNFREVALEDLHLEDIVLKDAIFDDVNINNANFINVTFEDCKLINTHIKKSEFINTNFTRAFFTYKGNYKNYYTPTYIEDSIITNAVFDDCTFNRSQIRGVSGSAIMKNFNFTQEGEYGTSFINATDFSLRVDNCNISNTTFAALFENSTLYATNSTLNGSGFIGSKSNIFYIENCLLIDTSTIIGPKLLVMKNCKFDGRIKPQGTSYLGCVDIHLSQSKMAAN